MNNVVVLFLIALAIQLAAAFFLLVIGNTRRASGIAHILLVAGLILGFANTLIILVFPHFSFEYSFIFRINTDMIRFDPLGLFFLAIIQLIAIPTSIYSYSYFGKYIDKGKRVRSTVVFFIALLVSTQMIAVSNHAILFLICWELMSTSAYLGMIFENEKKEVQTGSFYYLIISHVAMYFLFVFFILLHRHSGSWLFTDFQITAESGSLFIILYILALIAFGIKAGFMPFHFWLPRAHPIAPTVLSAFLSGVIIKMGIFGLLRTFQFMHPVPEWIGWLVIVVSMISAILGVWYALAQHDIKELLAYHSVENIGIIGIGIGIGFIGSAHQSVHLQFLGFGGALLHTLNHAIFKNLLFIGSGVINQNLGTRNIDLMGGIVHRGKFFVMLFLIGSIAICGIPPLNGFISEFIIFNGFFATAKELQNYYPLLMLIMTVGLAFVGGLAVACFTKINSIMFLGTPRREIEKFDITFYEYLSLGILAFLCVIIGFVPQPVIALINSVLKSEMIATDESSRMIDINWLHVTSVFIVLSGGIVIIYALKKYFQNKYGIRRSAAWGCGYADQTPRMQYTASSYANELNEITRSVLLYQKKGSVSKDVFPADNSFESHAHDYIDNKIIISGFSKLRSFISRLDFVGFTDIRYYIGFILVIITIYCLMALIWG